MSIIIDGKTAKESAQMVLDAIRENWDPDERNTFLRETDYGDGWQVCWEGGPYEWTMISTSQGDIWAEQMGASLQGAFNAEATFDFQGEVYVEPQNQCALNFYDPKH